MILKHPIFVPKEGEEDIALEKIKAVIEKYKDRLVFVEHGLNNLWLGHNGWVINKAEAERITFKDALKKTKHYKSGSMIRYHFTNDFGVSMPDIKDFDAEDVYNCPSVTFDNFQKTPL